MHATKFVRGYPRQVPLGAYGQDPLLPGVYTEGRTWWATYSRALHDRLSGNTAQPKDFNQFRTTYLNWRTHSHDKFSRHVASILVAMEAHADSDEDESPSWLVRNGEKFRSKSGGPSLPTDVEPIDLEQVTEKHFSIALFEPFQHSMLDYNLDLWACVLSRAPVPRWVATRAAIHLASLGADLWTTRGRMEDLDLLFAEETQLIRGILTGALAEIDLLVLLLMLTARRPHLVPLVAPPSFERWAGERNVDFLVVDTDTDHVVGVQCKASGAGTRDLKVDADRVIVASQTTSNHTVSGIRVLSKIVPEVTDTLRQQTRQRYRPTVSRPADVDAQCGQQDPLGQRSQSRHSASVNHARSSAKSVG